MQPTNDKQANANGGSGAKMDISGATRGIKRKHETDNAG